MYIAIQTRGFAMTDGIRAHCERRLRFALGARSARVKQVSVRLTDVNGPRGGVDKRVTLKAVLPGAQPVVINQDDADLYAAIDRAAERLSHALARRLDRVWRLRRDHGCGADRGAIAAGALH
jgi:ribosome-associated translation inhibitor RaiA